MKEIKEGIQNDKIIAAVFAQHIIKARIKNNPQIQDIINELEKGK